MKVGVIGAGTMGQGIAKMYITSGFRCQRGLYTDGYAVFYFSFFRISFFQQQLVFEEDEPLRGGFDFC